jgi:hypothetical protein
LSQHLREEEKVDGSGDVAILGNDAAAVCRARRIRA